MWWFGYDSLHGKTLSPSNAAFYVRLQNLQQTTSRLAGYDIESKKGDNWIAVVKFDSRFGNCYAIVYDNFKNANRIDRKYAFDAELASKSYVLQPGETVEGWVMIEYAKEFPTFDGNYRLSVADISGHQWSGIISWPTPNQKDASFLGGAMSFSGVEDVSSFYQKYYDDP